MELVSYYSRHLAVPTCGAIPARPRCSPASACSTRPAVPAATRPSTRPGDGSDPALRGQLIWPYTDLPLHDMGEGLADGRPEGVADGQEWRTAPLWASA